MDSVSAGLFVIRRSSRCWTTSCIWSSWCWKQVGEGSRVHRHCLGRCEEGCRGPRVPPSSLRTRTRSMLLHSEAPNDLVQEGRRWLAIRCRGFLDSVTCIPGGRQLAVVWLLMHGGKNSTYRVEVWRGSCVFWQTRRLEVSQHAPPRWLACVPPPSAQCSDTDH